MNNTDAVETQLKQQADSARELRASLDSISQSLATQKQTSVSITNTPSAEFAEVLNTLSETIESTLFPLVRSMDSRISQDIKAHSELNKLSVDVGRLKQQAGIS